MDLLSLWDDKKSKFYNLHIYQLLDFEFGLIILDFFQWFCFDVENEYEHLVYRRFTRVVAPRFLQDKMHLNEAYQIIQNSEDRDELIIRDVK